MLFFKRKISKSLFAAVISLVMVFSLIPMLQGEKTYAASEGVTVEFKTGDSVTSIDTYTREDLKGMATNSVSGQNYLAWDGTKYTVLNSESGISILDLVGLSSLPSGWTLQVTNGTETKSFGYQDISNGNFYGETINSTGIETNPQENILPIISLSTGTADVTEKAVDTVVNSHDSRSLQCLIGLPAKGNKDKRTYADYIKEESGMTRFISGVTKVSVIKPGPISNFKIYSQVGENGTKKLVKTFTGKELSNLATTDDVRAFLQSGNSWTVHATDKYIPIEKLISASGLVFNTGDKIKPAAADGFSTTQTYENLKASSLFYPGTTATATDESNPTQVSSVLALNWIGGVNIASTAKNTVNSIDWTAPNTTGRFYMGVSPEDYATKNAAGNRFVSSPVEMTLIKDVADTIKTGDIRLSKTSFTATGKQIKPSVTVKNSSLTLKPNIDYTVSCGTNKIGIGTVTIKGKGNFAGTITRKINIKPRATKVKSIIVGKKTATVKWYKAKDSVTGYQIAYKKVGDKTYKIVKVVGQKNISKSIKKLSKGKNYYFKVRSYKTGSGATIYSDYSKVIKSKKIK